MSIIFSAAIPEAYVSFSFVWVFILGAIIGSFLNVYVYRFHTGKSLAGNSHCLSCGERLRWFELFPIVSYIGILGHCRHCRSRVPIRYMLVELLTAVLFALCLTITNTYIGLLILFTIVSILIVIVVYDYYHYIIPDVLTATLTAALTVFIWYEYMLSNRTLESIGIDILGALAGSAFFLFLWVVSKGQWLGFGDVKLAIPLGLMVGAGNVFSFIVLSFWVGAAVSLLLLGMQRMQRGKSHLRLLSTTITMKSAVPFAPFLIAGAIITFFAHINVLSFFYFTL